MCACVFGCVGVSVGPLPAELAHLPSLAFLDLSHNQLTGSLDGFGAALTGSNNLLQVGPVCTLAWTPAALLHRPHVQPAPTFVAKCQQRLRAGNYAVALGMRCCCRLCAADNR